MMATKTAKKRGQAWSDAETLALLNLWQERNVEEQLDDPQMKNKRIYNEIAAEMKEMGFEKTSEQCKVKMHTLKRSYRLCKTKLGKSGKGRTTCKHFHKLDEILGSRPASSPVKVIETLVRKRGHEDSDLESDDSEDDVLAQEIGSADAGNEDIETNETTDQGDGYKTDEISFTGDSGEKERSAPPQKKEPRNSEKIGKTKDSTKGRKSRLEVALSSIMEGFSAANEQVESRYADIEKQKITADMKRIELERMKLESEERQRREERQHQYNMMQMILGTVGHRAVATPAANVQGYVPSPAPCVTRFPGPSSTITRGSTEEESSLDGSSNVYYNL